MRRFEQNRPSFTRYCGMFWLNLRWVNSEKIFLALAESHEDSQRSACCDLTQWESVTEAELELYHRQLFLWRLMRYQPTLRPLLSN